MDGDVIGAMALGNSMRGGGEHGSGNAIWGVIILFIGLIFVAAIFRGGEWGGRGPLPCAAPLCEVPSSSVLLNIDRTTAGLELANLKNQQEQTAVLTAQLNEIKCLVVKNEIEALKAEISDLKLAQALSGNFPTFPGFRGRGNATNITIGDDNTSGANSGIIGTLTQALVEATAGTAAKK